MIGYDRDTDYFIDNTLVGMEVKGQAGVAGCESILALLNGLMVLLHPSGRGCIGLYKRRVYSLFFNEYAGGPLGGFSANTTLQ
jgi:hypothetical protein